MAWTELPVYPRVCGGTLQRRFSILTTEGLSPRVRGNRVGRILAVPD